jgi:hypothetical protein
MQRKLKKSGQQYAHLRASRHTANLPVSRVGIATRPCQVKVLPFGFPRLLAVSQFTCNRGLSMRQPAHSPSCALCKERQFRIIRVVSLRASTHRGLLYSPWPGMRCTQFPVKVKCGNLHMNSLLVKD